MTVNYANGLKTIFEALKAQGGKTTLPGNAPTYEGRTFTFRPSQNCSCDCGKVQEQSDWYSEHRHRVTCFQQELLSRINAEGRQEYDDSDLDMLTARKLLAELGLPFDGWRTVCTCDFATKRDATNFYCLESCATAQPNFHHHPTNLKISWDTQVDYYSNVENPVKAKQWSRIVADCLTEALTATPDEPQAF